MVKYYWKCSSWNHIGNIRIVSSNGFTC